MLSAQHCVQCAFVYYCIKGAILELRHAPASVKKVAVVQHQLLGLLGKSAETALTATR